MKVEFRCKKCGAICRGNSEKIEFQEDNTIIFKGEKFTCDGCGNNKFRKMVKV